MLHILKPSPSPHRLKLLLLRSLLLSPPSSSFSSSSAPLSFAPFVPSSPSPNLDRYVDDIDLNPSDVASSFKDWFRSGTTLFDRIYGILASTPDGDGASLDAALSSLGLRLSEPLVLGALAHAPHPTALPPGSNLLLLRLRFFDWAGQQHRSSTYRHTRAAYHSIFRILSRARHASSVLEWLDHFSSARASAAAFVSSSSSSSAANPHARARFHDTLVVGYAVAGRPERALHLFAKMRFHGLDLDSFTYHVLLNSLVDAGIFDLAESLCGQIAARGFHGPVTDCITVKSLCKQKKLDEAVRFLREEMPESAVPGRAWVAGKAIATATVVHELCKVGRFDEGVELVEEFGAVEAYGVLATDLIGAGKLDSALKFLRSKRELEGYRPEDVHYNKLLFQLLKKNQLEEVYDVLVEMMEEGIVPSRATTNAALCFFCKAGMVDVAIELYRSRHELGISPSKWVYNHLMSALCRNGTVEEVCKVLEESMLEGYFPGRQAFSILANMLCREGKVKKLYELLDGAHERAVKPTTTVLARCISALCKQGELEKAWSIRHIFGGSGVDLGRYKYVYTGLIQAFISLGKVDVLPELIIQMQESGHSPSRSLYLAVVGSLCEMGKFEEVLDLLNKQLQLLKKQSDPKASDPLTFYNYFIDGAAHAKKLEVAMEVFNRMERAGIKPTTDTKIILLRGYLKSKRISNAIDFFSYICGGGEPNTRLYSIFISGLCEAGQVEPAMESWQEMRDKGMIPSLQCYEELVLALCTARDYDTVVKVLDDFRETGRPISAFICNVLLLHTLKGKELLRAWVDFKKAEANKGTLGSGLMLGELIAAFSGGIRMKGNLHNLEEDIERSFPVDIYTYNMLLRGLTMAGQMDYAYSLFSRIQKKGYEPNLWTYDIIVHGFCKQGNRKEAERWINEMYRNGYHPSRYTMKQFNTV